MPMSERICVLCAGTGQMRTMSEERGLGWASETHSSHLCPCRQALPARDGPAAWWSSETVFSGEASTLLGDVYEVSVRAEVPISEDNFRVHRRGNRYYPTLVDLNGTTLTPENARELALLLLSASDAADTVDKADTDACGHWAPCDCTVKADV